MRPLVDDFLSAIDGVDDFAKLRREFDKFVANLGFTSFAYVGLHIPPHEFPTPFVVTTYPQTWIEHYEDEEFASIDPVLTTSMKGITPFDWSSLATSRTIAKRQRTIFNDAKEIGFRQGLTVPIHGYGSEFSIVSITSDQSVREFVKLRRKYVHDIHIATLYYHSAVKRSLTPKNMPEEAIRLSPREMECLLWAAKGKSAWETSEILSISEHTVIFHLRNAMHKLGVYSKRQAVVKAIMHALICV